MNDWDIVMRLTLIRRISERMAEISRDAPNWPERAAYNLLRIRFLSVATDAFLEADKANFHDVLEDA